MPVTRSSLLFRIRQHGREADWQQFVEIYRPLIEQSARAAGIGPTDLDDVVQNVLLQLLRVLPKFAYQRGRGFFRHWLNRVVRNKVRDSQRQARRQPRLVPELHDQPGPPEFDDCEELFRRRLLEAAMRHARPKFRERTWQSFTGRILEGRSGAELACELGLRESAVYVNSSRVVSELRDFCAFHGEDLTQADLSLFE
jgi:RNA polymerase sigma-70 factor (ECF subfamily)